MVTSLIFCQNDYPIRGSFWQKDSSITHILFELCRKFYGPPSIYLHSFLDAIEIFFVNSHQNGATSWIPRDLPKNVKIIITFTTGLKNCNAAVTNDAMGLDMGGFHKLRKQFWGRRFKKWLFLPSLAIIFAYYGGKGV